MNSKILRKFSLSLLVLLLSSTILFAQDRKVTGKVTDQDGIGIPGVNVSLKGIPSNVSTNGEGMYTIQVKSDQDVLVFSYIGFVRQQVTVGNRARVDIKMLSDQTTLDEVVINVGYGAKKKGNVLGAVGNIKAEDIEDLPVANLGAALQNRVAGLGVNIASGKPGATTSLAIRNPTTFGASGTLGLTTDPLFVIDGLTSTKSDFDNLDASLVDNISFLKDASAAIYGAAGAKGVVLVTTKRGKPGKPRLSYASYFGTSTATETPNVLSAYEHAKMLNDGYELNNTANTSRFSAADLELLKNTSVKSWYDELWKPANLTRHTLNVSGGNERVTFFAGGNYYDEGGNFGDISIKKYGIRSGMDANISPSFKASISLNTDYSTTDRNTLKNSGGDSEDLMIRALFTTPGWVPLRINGLLNNWNGVNPPGVWNPQSLFDSGDYERSNAQGLSLNSSLIYSPKFLDGLTAKVQFGKFNRSSNSKQYFPSYVVNNFVRGGQNNLLYTNVQVTGSGATSNATNNNRIAQGSGYNNSYQLIGSVSYAKKIGKHDFDILALTEQTEATSDSYLTYRDGQQIPGVDEFFAFNAATTTIQLNGAAESGKRSYLARLNYSYNDRYIFEGVARYDGSANFPPDTRWGLFPAVGLGWKVSEEPFFKNNVKFINTLKIRANVGLVGDDRVQSYQYKARFTETTGMLFGSAITNGLDPSIYPNPEITWEKAFNQNYGIDATMFNDKISFAMDVWHRHTYDGFDNYSISGLPYTVGISSGLRNYGAQNSWGTEFTVGYKDNISKNWGFNINLIAGTGGNQLIQSYYSAAALGTVTEYANVAIGKSTNTYTGSNYGYIAKGILRTQGEVDAILARNPNYKIAGAKPQVGFMDFEDVNKDGIIDDNDITVMYDNVANKVSFGLTLGVNYKTLRLSTNFAVGVGGHKFVDSEARKVPTTTASAPSFWADHWTPETPNAKYPRADAPLARENSTFWSVSGTVARLNNAVLSYSIPKNISEKYRIPEFRAYITGTNLLNIYNPFDYKDPNTNNFATYPTLRTISLGLNISM